MRSWCRPRHPRGDLEQIVVWTEEDPRPWGCARWVPELGSRGGVEPIVQLGKLVDGLQEVLASRAELLASLRSDRVEDAASAYHPLLSRQRSRLAIGCDRLIMLTACA